MNLAKAQIDTTLWAIHFRITFLLDYRDYNLSNWEEKFLTSIYKSCITEKQYKILINIWEQRKIKDIQSKDKKFDIYDWDNQIDKHLKAQAMYGYQF